MKCFLLLLLLLNTIKVFPQKENNIWGTGLALIDFNFEPPVIKYYSPLYYASFQISTSFISDKNGNFLFWTNGFSVMDKRLLTGSASWMKGSSDTSYYGSESKVGIDGCLICPVPSNDSIYLLIASDYFIYKNNWTTLGYCVVNIKRNNGLGEVVQTHIPLLDSAITPVAAVRHTNNKDIWVVSHRLGSVSSPSNAFCSFLINEKGIDTIPIISNEGFKHHFYDTTESCCSYLDNSNKGSMRFSPDGRFLAKTVPADYDNSKPMIEIYNFNINTGKIKYLYEINTPQIKVIYCIAFSPNNRFLYATFYEGADTSYQLWQYDLSSGIDSIIYQSAYCIIKNKNTLYPHWLSGFWDIQNAPDGDLYIATSGSSYLSIVKRPNFSKNKCMYMDTTYIPNSNTSPLPNFIQSYVERVISSVGSCTGSAINFSANVFYPDSLLWDFGDPNSGVSNYSKVPKPFHTYNSPGLFKVRLFVFEDNYPDTIIKDLLINPVYNIAIDTSFCKGDSILIDNKYFTTKDSLIDSFITYSSCDSIINWNINIRNKIYFKLGNDTTLCKGNSLLLNPNIKANKYRWSTGDTSESIIVDKTGKYVLTISTAKLCPSSDSVFITFRNLPYVNLGRDTTYCELTSHPIILDAGNTKFHLWSPGGDTSRYKIINIPDTYYVKAWDQYNCTSFDSIHITDNCPLLCYIPDAFVPDGFNKVFKVSGFKISMVDMKIYNRWGELIFNSVGDSNTYWNGTFNQVLCPLGVYYYSINVCDEKGYCIRKTGSVTLIR